MDTDIELEFEYNEEVCKTIDFYQDLYGFGDPRNSMAYTQDRLRRTLGSSAQSETSSDQKLRICQQKLDTRRGLVKKRETLGPFLDESSPRV